MRYASTSALTVFGLVFATVFAVPVDVDVSQADETFTFAVAGDIGWNETGAKSQVILRALQRDKANLSFFLGDGGRMVQLREVVRRIPVPVRAARGGSRRQRRGSDRKLRGMPAGQARR